MARLPAPNQAHYASPYLPYPMSPPMQFQGNLCVPRPLAFHQPPYPPFNGIRVNRGGSPWACRRGGYGKRGGRGNKPHNHNDVVCKKINQEKSQTKGPEEMKSKDFHCEPCERDFQTEEHLNAHVQCHVKCVHEGCSFIASRKVLKLHEIQYHAPGRFRIKLDTPDEIAKWREERKRNYPTASNVARKCQKLEEKRENGQVLSQKSFRYTGRGENHGKDTEKWQVISDRGKQHNHDRVDNGDSERGTHTPMDKDEDPLSIVLRMADEDSDEKVQHDEETEVKGQSGLSSLCAAYGEDSSEEEGEIREERPVDENRNIPIPNVHTNQMKQAPRDKRKPKYQSRNKVKAFSTHIEKRRPTLLEMLLAPDICYERNIILQCICHIKKNNFFGIQPSQSYSLKG